MLKVASVGCIELFVHPDAVDWAPPVDQVSMLNRIVSKPTTIRIYPRYAVKKVYEIEHPEKSLCEKSEYYKFRAYAGKDYCTVFVDETETPESVMWVILHELAHIELSTSKYLFRGYRFLTAPNYFESDETHEADPEEQMANTMANAWMEMLGYGKVSYPRPWWRQRVTMNITKTGSATLKGMGLGASLSGLSGYSKALDERRDDQLEYMKGNLTRKQMKIRDNTRIRDLGLRTATGGVVGGLLGRATGQAIKRGKAHTKKLVREAESGGKRLIDRAEKSGKETAKRLAEETSKRYEASGKRIAEHSAKHHSARFAEKTEAGRKKLPRWMGGDKGWFGGRFGAKTASVESFHFFCKELRGE